MTQALKKVGSSVAQSLELWHSMVEAGDFTKLPSIVHPEAIFRSPVANSPYASAAALVLAIKAVATVFTEFKYHREFATDQGLDVTLEFSAHVGGKDLKGVDVIRFDEQGQIREFEVIVRPMSGLQALATEMAKRVGDDLPAFKSKT